MDSDMIETENICYDNFTVPNEIIIDDDNEVIFNGMARKKIVGTHIDKESGLNYYELYARPRTIVNVNRICITPQQIDRIIKEIFTCIFCMDILTDPVNIKTCLHKFCKKCIEDYIRTTKKECAVCRAKIETRRIERDDIKIKEIIKCFIPSITKYKDKLNQMFNANKTSYCFKALQLPNTQEIELMKKKTGGVSQNLSGAKDYQIRIEGNTRNDTIQRIREIAEHKPLVSLNKKPLLKPTSSSATSNVIDNISFVGHKMNRESKKFEDKHTQFHEKYKKIRYDVKNYFTTIDEAEKEIKRGNYLSIKLMNEKESPQSNKLANIILCMSGDMTLKELAIYIFNKYHITTYAEDKIYFYIYEGEKKISLFEKSKTVKEIKEIYTISNDYKLFYDYIN